MISFFSFFFGKFFWWFRRFRRKGFSLFDDFEIADLPFLWLMTQVPNKSQNCKIPATFYESVVIKGEWRQAFWQKIASFTDSTPVTISNRRILNSVTIRALHSFHCNSESWEVLRRMEKNGEKSIKCEAGNTKYEMWNGVTYQRVIMKCRKETVKVVKNMNVQKRERYEKYYARWKRIVEIRIRKLSKKIHRRTYLVKFN